MAFFPDLHDPSGSAVLDSRTSHPEFEAFYADHIRKLIQVRAGRRYLSKGNYNVTRAEYLLKHDPRWSSEYFFYEVYYVPQAMFQVGDNYFRAYYPKLVTILLDRQGRDGSWLSDNGADRSGGRNYCTAMAVLALAVEHRYLPIYQR